MFRTAMPDVRMTVEDEIYSRDRVVHRWTIRGTHQAPLMGIPPTGKVVTLTGITVVRFKAGKIIERWTQLSELNLLQQLGVVPPPPQKEELPDGPESSDPEADQPLVE